MISVHFRRTAIAALFLVAANPANALTLKSGEVIGSDGIIYQGASPQVKANIIKNAIESGDKSGVFGRSLFVVSGETVTFVPISEVVGKETEDMQRIIGDAVVVTLTGIPELTLATVQAAQEIAAATDVPLGRALIEQAFIEASAASLLADEDPLSADESQQLLERLIGPGLVNADQSEVTDEQIIDLLKTGDLDQLLELTGLAVIDNDLASADDISNALTGLGDLGTMADELNDLTAAAWEGISAEDLEEAIEEATDYAAQEAANVAAMLAADPQFAASAEGQALAEQYGL